MKVFAFNRSKMTGTTISTYSDKNRIIEFDDGLVEGGRFYSAIPGGVDENGRRWNFEPVSGTVLRILEKTDDCAILVIEVGAWGDVYPANDVWHDIWDEIDFREIDPLSGDFRIRFMTSGIAKRIFERMKTL